MGDPRRDVTLRRVWAACLAACITVTGAHMAAAQSFPGLGNRPLSMGQDVAVPRSPLLTIDRDTLFRESAYGKRLTQALRASSAELAEENQRITEELEAEENDLTERRESLERDEFRALADAFDAKVTQLRTTQDTKTRALQRRQELERQQFFAAALPILAAIVQEAGAVAILDRGTVFLTADQIDITELAIRRMDAALGDGSDVDTVPGRPPAPRPDGTQDTGDGAASDN